MLNPRFLAALTLALGLAASALAGDGQVDLRIDPATGATIDQPGSYVVVENVAMTADVPAITVTASDVTIDLGGHILTGFAGGTTDGVSGETVSYLKVKSGSIRGFGGDGIETLDDGRFEDLSISGCGSWAINVDNRGEISRVQARNNNSAGNAGGFFGIDDCVVSDCVISGNAPLAAGSTKGVEFNDNCRIERNTITDQTASQSFTSGIYVKENATIIGNTLRDISSTSNAHVAFGIAATAGAIVQNNSVSYCTGHSNLYGIFAAERSMIEGNTVAYISAKATGSLNVISTNNGAVVRGNTVNFNVHDGFGNCTGISVGSNCNVVNNTVATNREGAGSASTCIGINSGGSSVIIGNTCNDNGANGANGSGRGIKTGSGSLVRENVCDQNDATGTGDAAGIEVAGSCKVLDNHSTNSSGGGFAWGIRVTSTGNVISGNTCAGNTTAGLVFTSATNNRSEANRFRQTTGIDTTNGVTPGSLGAGTLADLTY